MTTPRDHFVTKHSPTARWYGGSTEPLMAVVSASMGRVAASSETDVSPIWIFQSQDMLVTATVRSLAEDAIAVAIETEEPQCAASRWHFRFTRADGMELCSGTLTLGNEQPGFWEGRVELALTLTEPWCFAFASLPKDPRDTP